MNLMNLMNLSIIKDNPEYVLYNNGIKIGEAILSEFGIYGKSYRFKDVLSEYNINLNLKDGLELAYIKIDKNYRGKGFSKYFINELIKLSKEKDKKFIMLEAADSTTKTDFLIKLYEKMGFKYLPNENGDYMIYILI